jgi:hypothetical protein
MSKREEIERILLDTYDDDEVATSWEVTFSDEVVTPFPATLLGIPVTVTAFRAANSGAIQCRVSRENKERWVDVEGLDDEGLPEDMAHILDLYRSWLSGDY